MNRMYQFLLSLAESTNAPLPLGEAPFFLPLPLGEGRGEGLASGALAP